LVLELFNVVGENAVLVLLAGKKARLVLSLRAKEGGREEGREGGREEGKGKRATCVNSKATLQ
jgi:hypothetical protein